MTYNPEAGLPVTGDSEWEHPDVMARMWTAGEIQAALTNLGFTPYAYDAIMSEPHGCDDPDECGTCDGDGHTYLILRRSKRWVKGDQALRVPNDPGQMVSPYLAACCAAAMNDA